MRKHTLNSIRLTLAAGSVLLLSACGSSDNSALDEKVQRAEEAAQRAETARATAEKAAQKAEILASHVGTVADAPQQDSRTADNGQQDPDAVTNDNNRSNDDTSAHS